MFWRIDLGCLQCEEVREDFWQRKGDPFPPCECGAPMQRIYLGFPSVHGDEIDYVDDNLGPNPIRIRSKQERKRLMKEQGLREKVQHVPVAGSDKSAHTQRFL